MFLLTAALNDAVAWCLLILAISIANAGDMIVALYVFLCTILFALGLFILVRPVFCKIVRYIEASEYAVLKSSLFSFTICMVFLSSWVTALLGVDAIFGAFLFGLIVPVKIHFYLIVIF